MAINGYRQLDVESISARTATPSVDIGERRVQGGNEYLYVYNGSDGEIIDIGRGCRIASQSSGYTVDVATIGPATITGQCCAGVCQDATITTGGYGWIMTKGKAVSLQNKISLVVTGRAIYMGISGTFQAASALTVHQYQYRTWCGTAIDAPSATSATGTFAAWVDCKVG